MKTFFDCKDEKITERAFTQGLITSVLSILLCIVALCSITYAWFSGGTSSDNNTMMSGSFDVSVSVSKTSEADGTQIENSVVMNALEDGRYHLSTPGTYTVTLIPSDEATVKGYCIVTLDSNRVYRTDVILNDKMLDECYTEVTAPFTFTIVVDNPNTVLRIEPHWGILVEHDIVNGDTID